MTTTVIVKINCKNTGKSHILTALIYYLENEVCFTLIIDKILSEALKSAMRTFLLISRKILIAKKNVYHINRLKLIISKNFMTS